MKIEMGIQPNCSECAFIINSDSLNKKQAEFIEEFLSKNGLTSIKTPKGKISIETGVGDNPDYKDGLWDLRDKFETLNDYKKLGLKENVHYQLMRDDSYYDAIEEGVI